MSDVLGVDAGSRDPKASQKAESKFFPAEKFFTAAYVERLQQSDSSRRNASGLLVVIVDSYRLVHMY